MTGPTLDLDALARVVVSPRWRVNAKLGEDVWIMADAGEGKATFIADFGMGVVAMMHAGEVVALRDALPGVVAELRALRDVARAAQAWRSAFNEDVTTAEEDALYDALSALDAQRGKGAGDG